MGRVTESRWTFMSNHGHVLAHLAGHPDARARDTAAEVGVTERAVQSIVKDLVDGGYLEKEKSGRRNSYRVCAGRVFRHPVEAGVSVDDFLRLLRQGSSALDDHGPKGV